LPACPRQFQFLVWDDARFALRVSNAILLAFLFFCGYKWARYTMGSPWVFGLIFLAGGFGLVAMAIALGG
jgi:hypothetical protein